MSKPTNPTLIGAFVIGAVALVALGAMLFGGADAFARKTQFVSYFPGSVKGLRVGSNVLFRGVRVGYVREITLLGDIRTLDTRVQVTMEVFPEQFLLTRDGEVVGPASAAFIGTADLIDAGLRAQLGFESFVTGQLVVELDLQPEQPAVFRGVNPPHDEIPSVPSNIRQVVERAQTFLAELDDKVDVAAIAAEIQGAAAGINRLAGSAELARAIDGLSQLVNGADAKALAGELRRTLEALRATLADTRALVTRTDARLDTLATELGPLADRLATTLAATEAALDAATGQFGSGSELSIEALATLREVEAAARALRTFLDYVERNPEALLRGKRGP